MSNHKKHFDEAGKMSRNTIAAAAAGLPAAAPAAEAAPFEFGNLDNTRAPGGAKIDVETRSGRGGVNRHL